MAAPPRVGDNAGVRPLSPATRALVERLTRPPGPLERLLPIRRRAAIAALGRSGELAAALPLLPLLLDDRLARPAARALAWLLRGRPVVELATLEHTRAQLRREPSAWSSLAPEQVAQLGRLPHGWAAVALASQHPDGRVRLAAVQALAVRRDSHTFDLPLLLLRLNDWAEPVRAAARTAVEARLHPHHAQAWIRALPLLDILATRRRVDHAPLLASVAALVSDPAARANMSSWTGPGDPEIRRALVRIALAAGITDYSVLASGLCVDDRGLARAVAAHLQRLSDDDDASGLFERALGHPDLITRHTALAALERRSADWRRIVLEHVLLARGSASRRLARDELRRLDPAFDPRAWYLAALARAAGLTLFPALRGLAECGLPSDQDALLPLLAHPDPRVRTAAVTAAARLARSHS